MVTPCLSKWFGPMSPIEAQDLQGPELPGNHTRKGKSVNRQLSAVCKLESCLVSTYTSSHNLIHGWDLSESC